MLPLAFHRNYYSQFDSLVIFRIMATLGYRLPLGDYILEKILELPLDLEAISKLLPEVTGTSRRRQWTPVEENFLLETWDNQPAYIISKFIHKTPQAVSNKATRFLPLYDRAVKRTKPIIPRTRISHKLWTADEDAQIRLLAGHRLSDAELRNILDGRTPKAVRNRLSVLRKEWRVGQGNRTGTGNKLEANGEEGLKGRGRRGGRDRGRGRRGAQARHGGHSRDIKSSAE